MYSEYDWAAHLDTLAVKSGAKKTYNTNKVLATTAAWRENDSGSAACVCVSMGSVYDAYYESRRCNEW